MNRRHATVISLFLALALVLGMVATVRTTRLGASAAAPKPSTGLAQRSRALDRAEAALRKAAARKPPALPPLPARPAAPIRLAAAAPPQRVVYVRPKPIVHVLHRHGGEHESGSERGDGGGFDD